MPRYVPRSMSRLMFIDTVRRRSPSTVNFATSRRILSTSASVRSFTLATGDTPEAVQTSRARAWPIPKIDVKATQICFWFGRLIPAIRAISLLSPAAPRRGKTRKGTDSSGKNQLISVGFFLRSAIPVPLDKFVGSEFGQPKAARTARTTDGAPKPGLTVVSTPLPLPLLVGRVGTDHPHHAFPPHDLAVTAHFLDRGSDFHCTNTS